MTGCETLVHPSPFIDNWAGGVVVTHLTGVKNHTTKAVVNERLQLPSISAWYERVCIAVFESTAVWRLLC